MFFRRILALAALLAAAGCTPGNNPPQTATPALPREIEREVGTVYPSPALQALVDRVGVGYLVQAGYRGDAMASLIDKLRRQSQLEDLLIGPAEEPAEQRGALSTHPAPDARLAALRSVEAARTPGESNRAAYLALIDGMSVDDAPEEGFVHGTTFVHPVMRLSFTVPEGFKLFNGHEGVLAFGPDRSLIYFSCSAERVEGGLDDWMRDRLKPTPTDIQPIEIGGAPAAIGARPRGSDTGLAQIRYVLIRHGDGVCAFNLTSDSPNRDRRIETLIAAAKSFRALSPPEVTALRPYRLRIVERRESARQLALRLPYPDLQLQRLLALNGVDDEAAFDRLTEIKTVEP